MSFDEPRLLAALLLLVPFAALAPRRFARRSAAFQAIAGNRGPHASAALGSRYALSTALFTACVACCIAAAAGPRWGERLVSEPRIGADVAFAFDLSRSMDARDVQPSRLGRAAAIARGILETSRGGRFAAALGRGSAALALPLTDDSEAMAALLEALATTAMTAGGTDLEALVDAAVSAFPPSSSARGVVVLFSDGEALSGDLSAAAGRAAAVGVSVVAVGLGSEAGAGIPVEPDSLEVLRGLDGTPVASRLRREALEDLAERTRGLYVDGSSQEAGRSASLFLASAGRAGSAGGFRTEAVPRFHLFLLAALLLFGASKLAESPSRRSS